MSHCYKYPRPSVTVDAAIVAEPEDGKPAQLLLIQRKNPPCKGQWALPGGFVDENESLDKAAARELQEETSISLLDVLLTQDDASDADWFDVRNLPQPLAFDHKLIVRTAFQHLLQQPAMNGNSKLEEDLKAGAAQLEGPWEPP